MTQPLTSLDGLSTLVLTNLPPAHRKLIRHILRQVEPTYAELCQAVATWPEPEQLSQSELDEALKLLREQHYLVELGDTNDRRYKVSFSRRANRESTQNLWENVDVARPVAKPARAEPSSAEPPLPPSGDEPTT